MREVWRRRRWGISAGVSKVGLGASGTEASGVVRVVDVDVCESSPGEPDVVAELVPDSELSSRRTLMTGTSSAVLMYLSSRDGGRPRATMRFAFANSTWSSLSCEMRYMLSSPASTVSHMARMRFSIMDLSVGFRASSERQCCDDELKVSMWSSSARKSCFVSFDAAGDKAGRIRKSKSMGVAMNMSALFVTYPLPILPSLASSSCPSVRSPAISQLLHSFFGA